MSAISGIDWASDWHDVRISDTDGTMLLEERFTHDEAGISELVEVLLAHRVECCAIERPDGLLVGRLLAAGICVLAIHPNQVKAARDRYRAAAGKSDRFDAMVLCELARTDRHRFPGSGIQQRPDHGAEDVRADPRRPRSRARRARQPTARPTRRVLARRSAHLRRCRQSHRSGVLGTLSRSSRRTGIRREAPRKFPRPALLQRASPHERAAEASAQRTHIRHRRAGVRSTPRCRDSPSSPR